MLEFISVLRPLKTAALLVFVSSLLTAGWVSPGKYNGVVIFDRWNSCYLYSGVFVMAVSEKAKAALRPFRGKPMLIDVEDIHQLSNPGEAMITKLRVHGPSEELVAGPFNPPSLDGLSLAVLPSFSPDGQDELIVQMRNESNSRRVVDTTTIAPTLLAKKQGLECFDRSNLSARHRHCKQRRT